MTNSQRADIIKLVDALVSKCDTSGDVHDWRLCKHCRAIVLLQDRDARAITLLTVLSDHLKAAAALRKEASGR